MPNLLSFDFENPNFLGYRLISIIFVVFVIVGLVLGFVFVRTPQTNLNTSDSTSVPIPTNQVTYEGTITYIDSFMYPEDKITYVLTDKLGNEIILLKANDQKLEVSEGHYVEVSGEKKKIIGGKADYLLVNKLTIKNATN